MKSALIVLVVLVVAFLSFGLAWSEQDQERYDQEQDIADCRKKVADELSPIEHRRTMRVVCDALEKEFKQRWGYQP